MTGRCWVLSAADKVTALRSMLRRQKRSRLANRWWDTRGRFVELVPYVRRFHATAAPLLPVGLADELHAVMSIVEQRISQAPPDWRRVIAERRRRSRAQAGRPPNPLGSLLSAAMRTGECAMAS